MYLSHGKYIFIIIIIIKYRTKYIIQYIKNKFSIKYVVN